MSPEFVMPNETSVLENTALNTVVTVVKAIDRDEGRNGYLEYSLSDSSGGMFTLGNADGLLRVNGKLDRETKANYTLKVKAKDRGEPPRQTEAELVVRVLDENDNSPTFNPKQYFASIAENATIGVTILQVNTQKFFTFLTSTVEHEMERVTKFLTKYMIGYHALH